MKIKLLFCSLLFLLCISGCSKDIVDTTGNIVGIVRDARTNNLLEGATVTLTPSGKTYTTGSDGRFEFRNMDSQNYTVQVTKSEYKPDSKTVFVTPGIDNQVNFSLTPSVSQLTLSQTTLDFGSDATTLTFDVRNTGNAALTWSISEDIHWLTCSPTSGTVQAGETASVVVSVSREGLERGNYSQNIAIASNGGSEVVKVNMVVSGITVSVSPEMLDFGSTTTAMQLTMTNNSSNSGTVTYTLTPSNNWIKLNRTTGVFTTTENVTVSVERSAFAPGDYSGTIKLTVGENNLDIPVKMNIPNREMPTVTMYSVDDESYNSALFRGAIISIGSSKVTRYGFCWNRTGEPTVTDGQTCNFGDCLSAKDFTYNATGLLSSSTYYVRVYAENVEGISYSNVIKFQTKGTPQKPGVETGSVTGIEVHQATVGGNLVSLGNVDAVSQYGHVWSTSPNPTTSNFKTELGRTSQTGVFQSTLADLKPYTTYHVRAYATNSIGTEYGSEVTFTTLPGDVLLQTSAPTAITYNSATVACRITDKGGHTVTERGVCWNTSPTPTINHSAKKASTSADSYEVHLTDLKEKTRYYVRAYVKTQNGQIFYGNEVVFTTNAKDVNISKTGYGSDHNWER